MEISSEESETTVRRICEHVSAAHEAGRIVTPEQQLIYDVDYLAMEANSGASYEQYFRWASLAEIRRIVNALRTAGLGDVADLTERAIGVAFPMGIPATDEEKSDLTDWSEDKERELEDLFSELEEKMGHITNTLAAFAARVGA